MAKSRFPTRDNVKFCCTVTLLFTLAGVSVGAIIVITIVVSNLLSHTYIQVVFVVLFVSINCTVDSVIWDSLE